MAKTARTGSPVKTVREKAGGIPLQGKQHRVKERVLSKSHLHLYLLAGVVLITMVLYFPALHNQFTNWDDGVYVINNQQITSLSFTNIKYIFTHPVANNYHPLTILSLALNYKVAGLAPASYYLVNILLHLLNILLVFWLVSLLSGNNRLMALFTAALFAVHPMHVESAAWISERKDVLYSFFFLGGLIAYLHYLDNKKVTGYFLCLLLFLFSALSKPTAVVFPVVLIAIDWFRQRKPAVKALLEKLPFFIISVWIGLQTIHSQTEMVKSTLESYTLVQKMLFGSYGFFMYIVKLVVPSGLSAFYPFPPAGQPLPWIYILAPVISALLVAAVIYSLRYTKVVAFGVFFYFITISLTLQFLQVGHSIISDRYTYIPYIGLLMALFWITEKALPNQHVFRFKAAYLLFLLFFSVNVRFTLTRVPVWENSETLWTDVIAKYPETDIAYNNRGLYYFGMEKYDQSYADYTKAIAVNPNYFEAYYNRGGLGLKTGKPAIAIADFSKAISLNPNYSLSYRYRADGWSKAGKPDSAILDYGRAIRMNPEVPEPYCNRGYLYLQMGQLDEAVADFQSAIGLREDYYVSWFNLGISYGRLGKYTESISSFTKALEFKPDYYDALINRAMAEAAFGKKEEALRDMTDATRMSPDNPLAFFNRAIFFLIEGKKDLACSDLQMAAKLGNKEAGAIFRKECGGKQ